MNNITDAPPVTNGTDGDGDSNYIHFAHSGHFVRFCLFWHGCKAAEVSSHRPAELPQKLLTKPWNLGTDGALCTCLTPISEISSERVGENYLDGM